MFGIGWQELLLIFVIVLLLFGAKRIPEIAQGLGKGIREFKRAMKDTQEEIKGSLDNEGTRDYDRARQIPDRDRDRDDRRESRRDDGREPHRDENRDDRDDREDRRGR